MPTVDNSLSAAKLFYLAPSISEINEIKKTSG